MTFAEVIEQLRDGKAYRFGHANLQGFFYKAPYPEQPSQTDFDGACSAITYWVDGELGSPVLMLYDFDDDAEWYCTEVHNHPVI